MNERSKHLLDVMEADAKQTAEYLQAQMRAMAQQHALKSTSRPALSASWAIWRSGLRQGLHQGPEHGAGRDPA